MKILYNFARSGCLPLFLLVPASARSDQGGLLDGGTYDVPAIPRPGLREPLEEPVFGTTLTRITDPAMAPDAKGLRHEYARYPVVSADLKKVVVTVLGGADRGRYQVREVATGKILRVVPGLEITWHPTDPNLLIFNDKGNRIRRLRVDTGQIDTLITFNDHTTVTTKGEGRASNDWRYYAGLGTRKDGTGTELVLGNLETGAVVARQKLLASADWVTMSPKGNYVIVQYVSKEGTCAYRIPDLAYHRQAILNFPHSDVAIDGDGEECLVYVAVAGGEPELFGGRAGIACVRLRDGRKQLLLESHYWWSNHVSGIASAAHPGWVLISTYVAPAASQRPFTREVFWLKMDGSGEVRRIAHHHSDQASSTSGKDYWAEPHATSSWDGRMVVFSSVWGSPFERYDLYEVEGDWFGDGGEPPPPPADRTPPAAPANVRRK